MNRRFFLFLLLLPAVTTASAQSVTFAEHIAPIIYNHCTSCHRPGEIGPFPLTNYSEVVANITNIRYVTNIRYMPPWKPDPSYRHYQKENYLTQEEIRLIADWHQQGMNRGNPALEPPAPVFPSGSQIGVPDLSLSFAQSYTHRGNDKDEYRYFVIPTGLTEDKDLVALEVRPGNKSVVHHTLIWEDTTGKARLADLATPEYGYAPNETGQDITDLQNQLPGYVPGMRPSLLTNGIAQKLHAGADLKLQMHYAPTSSDESDSTTINLFFAEQPATRYLRSDVMLPLFSIINDWFVIGPNQVKEFHGRYTVPFKVSLYSVTPHMHLLGTHWKVYAVKPGGDTVPLIHIPSWDFNWQGEYQFKKLIVLPAGSVIHAFAGYDNTTNNENNPNNPPKLVTWGEGTADEMYYLPISYLMYQEGDENIEFDDNPMSIGGSPLKTIEDRLYPVAPNPASDRLTFGYTLARSGRVNLYLYNTAGALVRTIAGNQYHLPGYHTHDLNVQDLPAGMYMLVLQKGAVRLTERVAVIK